MTPAETPGETQTAPDTASEQTPQVPKWRLDELSARLRAREEELVIKNQLLDQHRPRQAQGPTPEELGIDPQVAKAVNVLLEQRLKAAESQIAGAFASVNNQTEETRFLVEHGKDKSKYMEKIRAQRQAHASRTGGQYQSVEDAYKIVAYDEMMAKATQRPAAPAPALAVQTTPASAPQNTTEIDAGLGGGPDASQTRTGAGSSGAAKGFAEMTLDEQEAYLDRTRGEQLI